jgi:hypothetical protein
MASGALIAPQTGICTSVALNSAYRVGLAIALVYATWTLGPNVVSYADLVRRGAQPSAPATGPKVSAEKLESMLIDAKQFAPDSRLDCQPADKHWDYVCTYLPTPRQSRERLQFGISVDAAKWVSVSRIVPMGTIIPAPR